VHAATSSAGTSTARTSSPVMIPGRATTGAL
jgi:hypothetical protein